MKRYYNREVICSNCNQKGHILSYCTSPITSYGIIAFKIVENEQDEYMDKSSSVVDILDDLEATRQQFTRFPKIKILLIQRKDTMAFSDIIRGKYSLNNNLENYFLEMTIEEQERLTNNTFQELWNSIWINPRSRNFKNDYDSSRQKFEACNIKDMIKKYRAKYKFSEFSIPKGRRNISETELECAKREFNEETGYTIDDYIIDNDFTITEKFTGSDNIQYKHIYFLAEMKKHAYKPTFSIHNRHQLEEIKGLGFFEQEQINMILRPYDVEKKKVIKQVFQLLEKRHM